MVMVVFVQVHSLYEYHFPPFDHCLSSSSSSSSDLLFFSSHSFVLFHPPAFTSSLSLPPDGSTSNSFFSLFLSILPRSDLSRPSFCLVFALVLYVLITGGVPRSRFTPSDSIHTDIVPYFHSLLSQPEILSYFSSICCPLSSCFFCCFPKCPLRLFRSFGRVSRIRFDPRSKTTPETFPPHDTGFSSSSPTIFLLLPPRPPPVSLICLFFKSSFPSILLRPLRLRSYRIELRTRGNPFVLLSWSRAGSILRNWWSNGCSSHSHAYLATHSPSTATWVSFCLYSNHPVSLH
ncbi:uncharacterized protein BO97DRAFT_149077 [Aspergillus homomorphus CBS 101889]|uniref:Uncharacterized protein n=1 Tax=Aspergillus homomorphus (strain CBS 101889) TaxID=1450537 RepID=A0A395HQ93_ASPHC|nr:hypothetical protein BO97DRAFT_149077 [Aspergillus homomorphus CBS 101889]RAL10111.1 hypothetical protein BO97DRAFT_149077 [Aspergillus homomorphus CBS 101889]